MKKLIYAVFVVSLLTMGKSPALCAEGTLSYEAASSSWNCHVISVSTWTPTQVIIGTIPASYMDAGGYRRISWYSYTMFNLTTSSAVYKMAPMNSDTAPAISCGVDAPIGAGAVNAPVAVTEQVIGMKIWMLSCHPSASQNFRIVQRGR